LQYQIAKAYLDGKGTDKDEQQALEWMKRAAKNGSGDAAAYLESHKPKNP
jgi:TPR repeat protein